MVSQLTKVVLLKLLAKAKSSIEKEKVKAKEKEEHGL